MAESAPEKDALLDLLAEHRMNAVIEGPSGERTRVKCDGNTCDFRAEGRRYWTVVREHDRHLADVLTRHYSPTSTTPAETHEWRAVGPNAAELWARCARCRADKDSVEGRLPCPQADRHIRPGRQSET